MRILGFSKMWPKLNNPILFTTFRYPRKDSDWEVEEVVQVVFKPRTKERQVLGTARIIRSERKDTRERWTPFLLPGQHNPHEAIRPDEAADDGFVGLSGGGDVEKMLQFFRESYGHRFWKEPLINKLTLYWISKEAGQ